MRLVEEGKNASIGSYSAVFHIHMAQGLWKMLKTFVSLMFHCGNIQVTWFVKPCL